MFTKNRSDPYGLSQIKLCFKWWKDRLLWHGVIIELFLSETELTCGKKNLLLLRALKNPIIVTYPSLPVFLSIFLPAYNVERIRSEYSLFPRLTNRTYSFVLFAFLLIAH